MSIQITTAFVEQYSNNVDLLVQQKGSVLRNFVDMEKVTGKNAFFEQIGVVEARERTTRHSDTPQLDVPHARRRVTLRDFDWADLIDDEDRVRTLIDPTGPYSKSASMAMGRSIDDIIIEGFTAPASTGVAGAGSASLGSGNKVAAASAGLTLAKLISAKQVLDENEVEDDNRHIAIMAEQLADLLGSTTVTSSDFASIKALVKGEIHTYLGFDFHRTQRLINDISTDTNRAIIAWHRSGLKLALGKDVTARIAERADKNHATQVFYSMTIGAVRMEEAKVVEVACVEA